MALNETEKVRIITQLGVVGNFNRNYSQNNRSWFVRHMIDHYASTGVADSDIRARVLSFIQQCKVIADSKKDFSIGVPFSSTVRRATLSRRIEIIYGALAAKPELANPVNANFLDFIIKRRFRSVMRMDYFVNPNSQGYFRYPERCSPTSIYKVVDDASSFWVSFDGGWNGLFFRLAPPPIVGPAVGPVMSAERLFIAKRNACQGNLLDCARVLSILFMDSLFEAANKDTLLSYLASKPDTSISGSVNSYIGICHPNDSPDSQFITDSTSEGLFSKPLVDSTELQVGDHVYIYNHPLYKVYNPNGSWRGEHALVYNRGDRNYRSRNGFMFGGHGKEDTLYGFYSDFMQELKTHIERTYFIARVHLRFMQQGSVSNGNHPIPGGGHVIVDTSTTGERLFEYHVTVRYHDYQHGGQIPQSRFLIVLPAGTLFEFFIDKETEISRFLANGHSTEPISLRRRTPPVSGSTSIVNYDPEAYSIVYLNQANNPEDYNLFQRAGTSIRLRQINISDLFASPFMVVPGTSNLRTTQPKVDVSPAYLAFLRLRGAIT